MTAGSEALPDPFVIGVYEGSVVYLDPDTGNHNWSYSHFNISSVDFDRHGNVYVGSSSELAVFDKDGNSLWTVGNRASDVAVGADGSVYTMAQTDNILRKYDSSGSQQWSTSVNGGRLVAVGPGGELFTGRNQTSNSMNWVERRDPSDGSLIWSDDSHGIGTAISGLVVGYGYVFSAAPSDDRIRRRDFDNGSTANVAALNNNRIGIGPDERIYYTYASGGTVRSVPISLSGASVITSDLPNRGLGIGVDADGFIYVNVDREELVKLDQSGTVIWEYSAWSSSGGHGDSDNDSVGVGVFGGYSNAY